jgi:hypothetical protein
VKTDRTKGPTPGRVAEEAVKVLFYPQPRTHPCPLLRHRPREIGPVHRAALEACLLSRYDHERCAAIRVCAEPPI